MSSRETKRGKNVASQAYYASLVEVYQRRAPEGTKRFDLIEYYEVRPTPPKEWGGKSVYRVYKRKG